MFQRLEVGENDVEGLWRLAKFCHELANQSADDATKKKLILEGSCTYNFVSRIMVVC